MKVALIGSRSLENIEIEKYAPKEITLLITGGARGVDTLAERYADKMKIKKMIVYPDYTKFGKNAPLIRDKEIVRLADIVIAIWDGKSPGTAFTVKYAEQLGKPFELHIIRG